MRSGGPPGLFRRAYPPGPQPASLSLQGWDAIPSEKLPIKHFSGGGGDANTFYTFFLHFLPVLANFVVFLLCVYVFFPAEKFLHYEKFLILEPVFT